jgi:phosphoribosyl 1,2-cyclic phosphodiesterase
MEVKTLATPHDAIDSVGFVVTALTTGARAGICYDVGHASEGVRALCRELDILVLEANHDPGMLWAGPYPPWLCQRIASATGHLSNGDAGALARDSVTARTAHVVLAHLSEKNNRPDIAQRAVRTALRGTAFRGTLSASSQDAVIGPFVPKGSHVPTARQLSLF